MTTNQNNNSSDNNKKEKSPLEKLLETSIAQGRSWWSTDESDVDVSGRKKRVKSYCSDGIEDTLRELAQDYYHIKQPIIVATTGGAHGELSLYANLADNKRLNNYPVAFFSSLRNENLDYLEFLIVLSLVNKRDRFGFLRDLFNIKKKDYYAGEQKKKVDSLPDALKFNRIEKLLPTKYSAKEHLEHLDKVAIRIKDRNLRIWFKSRAESVVKNIIKKGQYEHMKKGIFQDIKNNPNTYWLASDQLYRTIPKSFSDGKVRIHTFQGNIREGAYVRIKELLRRNNLYENISEKGIFYTPNLEREMPELLNFVKKFHTVIVADRLPKDAPYKRKWNLETGIDIVIEPKKLGIPEKYDNLEKEIKEVIDKGKLKQLNKEIILPKVGGLEPRLILGHQNLGSAYCATDFIRWVIELANNMNLKNSFWGGGPQGTFLLKDNQRRQQLDPRYRLFDDQLGLFKELREEYQGDIKYMTNENDRRMIDILGYLLKEMIKVERGEKPKRSYNVLDQIVDFAKKEDFKKEIIRDYIYPYMLRIGEDPAGVVDEHARSHNLLVLFHIFTKMYRGKPLLKEEEDFLKKEGLENTKKFTVLSQANFQDLENKVRIEFIRNSKYSRETQYVNFSDKLIKRIRNILADSNTNPGKVSDIFVDLHQPANLVTSIAGRYAVFVPRLDQDSRYYDQDFLPNIKDQVLQDSVHKRDTIRSGLNYPGGLIMAGGGYGNNLYVVPLFERIMEQQQKLIKSGEKREKVSIFFTGDLQFANHSQRPKIFVWAQEYALQRGCSIFVYNGDLIHGFNYRSFMLENQDLGLSPIALQQEFVTNMFRRYYTDLGTRVMKFTHGNHERNTDWDSKGFALLSPLISAVKEHMNTFEMEHGSGSRNLEVTCPFAAMTDRGELIKGDIDKLDVYDEHFIIQHEYGLGSGQRDSPTSRILSWLMNMAPESHKYNWIVGAHWHSWELRVDKNTIMLSTGAPVVGDAYSWTHQYYVEPSGGTIVDIYPNGLVGIENISPVFLANKFPDDYRLGDGNNKRYGSGMTIDEYIINALPSGKGVTLLVPKGGKVEEAYLRTLSPADKTKEIYEEIRIVPNLSNNLKQ